MVKIKVVTNSDLTKEYKQKNRMKTFKLFALVTTTIFVVVFTLAHLTGG